MTKKILCVMAIVSLIATNGFVNLAKAASLTSISDKLSDSDKGVTATHNINFNTNTALVAGQYIRIDLPAAFASGALVGNVTCPANTDASVTGTSTVLCTANAGVATGTKNVIITSVTNPVTIGSYLINVTTRTAAHAVIEQAYTMVAIVDNVDVSATVASTLQFVISPLNSGTDVNGFATTKTSATSSLAFDVLTVGTSTVMGQSLSVITNADNGYAVTVEQDQNLTSNTASDIDSFIDGTSTAPQAWQAPANTLDSEWTYGHFGFTTEDGSLAAGDTFGSNLWRGFASTTPVEIMFHSGPSDGAAPDKGYTEVAYRIEVSPLQEAGDYYNTLTYIATPVY